jgi:Uma2 family endonuclease
MVDFNEFSQRADDAGIRVEIIGGLPVWEMLPNLRHQKTIDRIRESFKISIAFTGEVCECKHYSDLHIKFPDGSDKRPDISIFCKEPSETDTAVTTVPEAVVEIISRGYEKKDLELGPPFYLTQGVKDIFVFDPYTEIIHHFTSDGEQTHQSPFTVQLQCGCQITI